MISRQKFLKQALGTAVVASTAGAYYATRSRSAAQVSSGSRQTDALVFPKNSYTTKTKKVVTSSGTKTVTYHYYHAIPYVAHPVDVAYQSMDISVPVTINGVAVTATRAPILFDIPVGGYLSSSVSGSTTSGGGSNGGPPPGGTPPAGGGQGGAPSGTGDNGNNADLALAAGYVVVTPGARGRDNVTSSGRYYGKAPAAIVDLKAAVRYLRHNQGVVPGNTDRIVSTGVSAGGALSALLGASANSPLYDSYLTALGAANASDAIYASAAYCPITDLEHADMAYEWTFGTLPVSSGSRVDQTISQQLRAMFVGYQASLRLTGQDGFGVLTAGTYDDYLLKTYLEPAATTYLRALSSSARTSYLAKNTGIAWKNNTAAFTFAQFLTHLGARRKSLPAFDSFTLGNPENSEFGDETTNARHFTLYSLRHATGNTTAQLASDLPTKIAMMNPMYFLEHKNPARAKYWFFRVGTSDTDTTPIVVSNLDAITRALGDSVNTLMYWDAGHGANEDAPAFITWMGRVTGYTT